MLKETKIFIKSSEAKSVDVLLKHSHESRDAREERTGNVSDEDRKAIIAKERELLSQIESMKPIFDKYLKRIA